MALLPQPHQVQGHDRPGLVLETHAEQLHPEGLEDDERNGDRSMTLPNGFAFATRWASDINVDEIVEAIKWEQRSMKMFGRDILQPRLTSWMGDRAYTYSSQRHEPAPIPDIVQKLKERIENKIQESRSVLGRGAAPTTFNSVLANLYRDGRDSVSWHADDEPELGPEPVIASLSLGAARVFSIRSNANRQRWDMLLKHGDILVMSGRSQLDYQHCVPKVGETHGPRVNLTFRLICG